MTSNEIFSNDFSLDNRVVYYFGRLDVYHESIYYISLIFYLLIAYLLILFSRYQPLASRGITPLLTITIQFLYLFFGGIQSFYLSYIDLRINNGADLMNLIIFYPLILVFLIVFLNSYARYMIFVYLTQKKVEFVNKNLKIEHLI